MKKIANKKFDELYSEFQKIVASGDEATARKFLTDHMTEFPEDIQGKIALAFLEEGLQKRNDDAKRIVKFQNVGISLLRDLEVAKLEKALE